jgi:hypothetical protein
MHIFTIGEFTDIKQAQQLSQRLTKLGKQAFVTEYLDGKRVN